MAPCSQPEISFAAPQVTIYFNADDVAAAGQAVGGNVRGGLGGACSSGGVSAADGDEGGESGEGQLVQRAVKTAAGGSRGGGAGGGGAGGGGRKKQQVTMQITKDCDVKLRAQWWRMLKDEDMISLEPLNKLRYAERALHRLPSEPYITHK